MDESTIAGLQKGMRAAEWSARELAEAYLARIEEHSDLNAVIEVNPDALHIADERDTERRAGRSRGPLHGIPILIKDNIDTADRMMTTAGSLALAGAPTSRDAFIVRRLREAGAVLLGKTNLSEWANFRSTRSTSGWSSRGGQTRNPYALDRNPCGSSSGSAVAVSANLCAVAVGTETDGSIICPSSINGIVGIKPTVGLVSRSGIIPISHSQDTAGPMARTVTDAAILLSVLAGEDPEDPVTATGPWKVPPDFTSDLDPGALRGARIGVARNFFGFHERVDDLMEEAIAVMREEGAEIVDPANINTDELRDSEIEVMLYEFKEGLNRYLASRGTDSEVRSLQDLIAFNEAHRERVMPYFGQELLLMAEEKGPLTEERYQEALRTSQRLARDEGIDATLREHRLDAIIAPSRGPAWLIDLVNGDLRPPGTSTAAAVAGYPSITVPAGFVWELPVGLSFIGGAYQEPTLLRLAFAFEQATRHRRAPRFLPSVELRGETQ